MNLLKLRALGVKLLKKSSNFTSRAPNLSKFASNGSTASQTQKRTKSKSIHFHGTLASALLLAPKTAPCGTKEPQGFQNGASGLPKWRPRVPKTEPRTAPEPKNGAKKFPNNRPHV